LAGQFAHPAAQLVMPDIMRRKHHGKAGLGLYLHQRFRMNRAKVVKVMGMYKVRPGFPDKSRQPFPYGRGAGRQSIPGQFI
jgi:hypothetical protein